MNEKAAETMHHSRDHETTGPDLPPHRPGPGRRHPRRTVTAPATSSPMEVRLEARLVACRGVDAMTRHPVPSSAESIGRRVDWVMKPIDDATP